MIESAYISHSSFTIHIIKMSAILKSLARVCGTSNPPGTAAKLYYWKKGELNAWPQTKAAAGGTAPGDTKRLDGNFDFIASGYMRSVDILVDTGQLKNTLEGEPGGQGYKSEIPFFVLGTSAEQLEFADSMVSYSGCLIAMIKTRVGDFHVVGNLDSPCFVATADMDTGGKNGDKSGTAFNLYAATGFTSFIYEGDLHETAVSPVNSLGAIPSMGMPKKVEAAPVLKADTPSKKYTSSKDK